MFAKLVLLERKTLWRGFLICFVVILPFTFFPVIFSSSRSIAALIERIPMSLLYTTVFSLTIILAAVVQNVVNLRRKIRWFAAPAFDSLRFNVQHRGAGSIVREFEPVLIGRFEGVLFLLSIQVDDNDYEAKVFYVNLSAPEADNAIVNKAIIKSLKDIGIGYWGQSLSVKLTCREEDLQRPDYLKKYLSIFAVEINKHY